MNGLPESVKLEAEKYAKQDAEDARISRIYEAANKVGYYTPDDSGQDFCKEMSKRILAFGQTLKDEEWSQYLNDIQSPWDERLQNDAFLEAIQILQSAVSGDENTVFVRLRNVIETDNIEDPSLRKAKREFRDWVFEALRRDIMFKLKEISYSSQVQSDNSKNEYLERQTLGSSSNLESNDVYTIGHLIRDLAEYQSFRTESENNKRKQGGKPAMKGTYAAHYAILAGIAAANANNTFSRIPKDVIDQIRPLCEFQGEFDVKTIKTLRANICIYFGELESSVNAMSPSEFRRLTLERNEQRERKREPLMRNLVAAQEGFQAVSKLVMNPPHLTIPSEIYDGQPEPNTPSGKVDKETKLGNRYEKAFQSYQFAESKLGNCTDRDAYDWLTENGPSQYELPGFDTWKRYVRQGRNHYSANKNSPLAGRSGRSIVGPED